MLMVVAFFVGVEIGCFEVFFSAELAFVVLELSKQDLGSDSRGSYS